MCFFFFFQAEDGIRDYKVTGVQTCALPISLDDVAQMTKASLYKRVAVTVVIFSLGILVSLYLARKYTQPLHDVVTAAKHVAAGDLTKTIEVEGEDEIEIGRASCRERV